MSNSRHFTCMCKGLHKVSVLSNKTADRDTQNYFYYQAKKGRSMGCIYNIYII